MPKKLEIDGVSYRYRRGKLVRIPDEWLGRITTKRTIRKRKDKARLRKLNRKRRTRLGGPES